MYQEQESLAYCSGLGADQKYLFSILSVKPVAGDGCWAALDCPRILRFQQIPNFRLLLGVYLDDDRGMVLADAFDSAFDNIQGGSLNIQLQQGVFANHVLNVKCRCLNIGELHLLGRSTRMEYCLLS